MIIIGRDGKVASDHTGYGEDALPGLVEELNRAARAEDLRTRHFGRARASLRVEQHAKRQRRVQAADDREAGEKQDYRSAAPCGANTPAEIPTITAASGGNSDRRACAPEQEDAGRDRDQLRAPDRTAAARA